MNNYYQQGNYRAFPPVVKSLIIVNVIMFFLTYMFRSLHFGDLAIADFIYENSALYPLDSAGVLPSFKIWQLITYQFLHGGFEHILMNMFVLWMFGAEVENMWGGKKFLIYYILSGIGAGIAQLFVSPLLGAIGPTVGASGSIYGVTLAFAMIYPNRQIMIFPLFIPIKAKYLVIGYIAYDLIMGLTQDSNVAHFAHLGGALTGFLLVKFGDKIGIFNLFDKFKSRKAKTESVRNDYYSNPVYTMNWSAPKDEPVKNSTPTITSLMINGEEITQITIDSILDKISASGYQNLTEREKKILFELSKKI